MVVSKAGFLYGVLIFYGVIILFMGFAGDLLIDDSLDFEESSVTQDKAFDFFPNIITGFSNTPLWINIIIFSPLTVTVLFVIVTTIFGFIFDGGS